MLRNHGLKTNEQYNKESIDPIDRMIDSINKREEIKKTMIPKTKESELFFKKYSSIFRYYKNKFPHEDPLIKVLDEIDFINELIIKENNNDNLVKLNNKLSSLKKCSDILVKGFDTLINVDVLCKEESTTIFDR